MSIKSRNKLPFGRAISMTLGMLVLSAVVLIVLTYFQGPRVHSVDAAVANATSLADQRVTFHLNQPISAIEKSNVSITPAAPFTVMTNGKMVTIEFDSKLHYNKRYTIKIHDVFNSRQRNVASTIEYAFTTSPGEIYYLKRQYNQSSQALDKKPADRIVRTHFGSTRGEELYRSTRIQEFVIAGDYLVVCILNNDFTTALRAIDLRTNETKVLATPGKGVVSNLRALPGQSVVGMSFSTMTNSKDKPEYSNALHLKNVETDKTTLVKGFDDKQLEVQEWAFSPDGSTVVAHLTDKTVVAASLRTDAQPVPYGQVMRLRNISYDGTKTAVMLRDGPASLDLISRQVTPFSFGAKTSSTTTYPLDIRMLSNGNGYLARLNVTNATLTEDMTYITAFEGKKERVKYASNGSLERIDGFYTTLNDQYLIVEKHPASSVVYDDYGMSSQPIDSQTAIIDMSTGEVVKTIIGRHVELR